MIDARPLPPDLAKSYRHWKANGFEAQRRLYRNLVDEGQHPSAMIVSCCDSRVHATRVFDAGPGEFFIHRNIANIVPPYGLDGISYGTSAAVEYAVTVLRVAHIMVMGHSNCGGVRGCHDMCRGDAPELEERSSLVGRWVDLLRPVYDQVSGIEGDGKRIQAFEREAVKWSLGNLMAFPFVRAAVVKGSLTLHGLWIDIATGRLEQYDARTDVFSAV